MWQASPEQAHRAQTIANWFAAEIPRLFQLDRHLQNGRLSPELGSAVARNLPPADAYARQTIAELEARFGEPHLGDALTDFYLFPMQGAFDLPGDNEWRWLAYPIVNRWLLAHPSDYLIDSIAARVRHMFLHILDELETKPYFEGKGYHPAGMRDCLAMLETLSSHARALEPIRALLSCEWNVSVRLPFSFDPSTTSRAWWWTDVPGVPDSDESRWSYDWWWREQPHQGGFWNALADAGALTETMFRKAVIAIPFAFPSYALLDQSRRRVHPEVRRLADLYMTEVAADLSPVGLALRERMSHGQLFGTKWLIAGCRHIEERGLAKVDKKDYASQEIRAIIALLGISGFDQTEVEGAIRQLAAFSPKTLMAALPHAATGEPLVFRALNQECLEPLASVVREISSRRFGGYASDVPNCGDPESGVVDARPIRAAVESAGEPLAKKYLKQLRDSGLDVVNTTKLIEALLGWNRTAIEQSVGKSTQFGAKAYGLLPITRGSDEVLERYLTLRQIAREVRRYGPERQVNTRAAVQAGLTNLAAVAGYVDRTWLEWEMEGRLSGELEQAIQPRAIDAWQVSLAPGSAPRVVVSKGGRELKAIPPKLKNHPIVLELKEYVDQLKEQGMRVRGTLEDLMTSGEPITPDQLRQIATLLSARTLVTGLVFRSTDGVFGVYDAAKNVLRGIGGVEQPLTAPVSIAHVAQLIEANVLLDWQREAVRLALAQPFKQLFRELYRPSTAELDAQATNRFASQLIEPKRATRLFQSRKWETGGDFSPPFRRFPRLKLRAIFDLPDVGHFLAETESVTTGQIRFVRELAYRSWPHPNHEPVRIADVPPLLFSEVMRDADLVVSVAAIDKDRAWSPEAAERRADAVRAVAAEFGLWHITFEGSFVHVKGKRRDYRIHLGSGSVHVEPGGHICTVPPGIVTPGYENTELLFPKGDEWKTAEVISTVLLFANDDKIKNADLLAQIGVPDS